MVKLLIADRDPKEREGLSWLVRAYPIPFEKVDLAGNVEELMGLLESETPDVLCVEMDMIPRQKWESFKKIVGIYAPKIIGMTAEATFERAMQAIELQVADLWVKPVSPDRIGRLLTRVYRQLVVTHTGVPKQSDPNYPAVSYQSLFLEQKTRYENRSLLLIQPEHEKDVGRLYRFLEEAPFHHRPDVFPLSDCVVCVFPAGQPDDKKFLQREGYRLLSVWSERYDTPLFLVICTHADLPRSLRQKYVAAKKALEMRFFQGNQQVIAVEGKIGWIPMDPFLSTEEQREWLQMLSRYDKEGIRSWMRQHFSYNTPPYPEPGVLRIRLTSILAQLRRFMQSHLLHEDPLFESHYQRVFATILHSPVLFRITQDILLFVYHLIDGAEERSRRGKSDIIEHAVQYVEKHYHRHNLSLSEVAEYVGRNASYLSHLLTAKKGVSFRELVKEIRIRHASRLLEGTTWTISEIAVQTGFKNPAYFSRVFKEKMGCSPRVYRDQMK